jgi:hypothetical protein
MVRVVVPMDIDSMTFKDIFLRGITFFIEAITIQVILPPIFSSSIFNFIFNVSILTITLTITQIILTELFIIRYRLFIRSVSLGSVILLTVISGEDYLIPHNSSFIVKLLLIIICYLEMIISILMYFLAEQFIVNKYKPPIITKRYDKLSLIIIPLIIVSFNILSNYSMLSSHPLL